MADETRAEVYRLHVWMGRISPMIWRRLLVRSDSTIADLHYTLQTAFGWSDEHLHRFHIHGQDYGVDRAGGIMFTADSSAVRLSSFLDTHRQVIAMCGDGGFTMLMQEFVTSVQHGLPVKVFVFNNAGWGLVHLEMEEAGLPVFTKGAIFKNPDFAMFAQACGAKGFRVT